MIECILKKPIKITIDAPDLLKPDYETVGKLIDNIIIMAHNEKKPLDKTSVGHTYSCEFVVGKKNKYRADFIMGKTMYMLVITYLKELTKYESTRSFAVPPKEKMLLKEAEKEAKKQAEEKKKEEKESSKKTTIKKDVKKETKKVVSKKTVKKESERNDYPDLD